MPSYLLKRLGVAGLVAITVSAITFLLPWLAGDPAVALAGEGALPEDIENLRAVCSTRVASRPDRVAVSTCRLPARFKTASFVVTSTAAEWGAESSALSTARRRDRHSAPERVIDRGTFEDPATKR